MSERRRYRIAGLISLAFHALLVLVIGLLAMRIPLRPEVLIPIELTVAERPEPTITLGGGGKPEAPKNAESAAAVVKKAPAKPSSAGGKAERAPAPPRLLTSRNAKEPAGPTGNGREPAGPAYGPNLVGGPLPAYPKDALDRGLEGRVILTVLVGSDGKVEAVTVESSSGQPVLDEAAVRAVKQGWVFDPGMANGKPAPGKARVTFEFSGGTVK
jgi:protein TonB